MNAYDILRAIAASLSRGSTAAGELCPFCLGGRTGEKSLKVTKTQRGYSLYICHRAKCRRKGRIDHGFSIHDASETPADSATDGFKPRHYRGTIGELPDEQRQFLRDRYGFSDEALRDIGWDADDQRSVWPVCSPAGAIRGYELRRHGGEGRTKTLHYRHSPDPWIGWVGPRSGTVVLVEDLVSARKVASADLRSGSLMGSHVKLDQLEEALDEGDDLALALDRDATATAIKLVARYSFLAPELRVVPLQRDLKYENAADIRNIIGVG